MKVTRRRFITVLGLAVVAAGAFTLLRQRLALRRWVLQTPIPNAPTGPLRDSTADTLLASVGALLGDDVETGHYMEFFRWRARNLPGHRRLYERFEMAVDRAARRAGRRGFRDCPRGRQQAILRRMMPSSGLERIRRGLVARDDARFGQYVVHEIFWKFARTDAWVLTGYDAWPGMPRAIASMGPRPRIT